MNVPDNRPTASHCGVCGTMTFHWTVGDVRHDCVRAQAVKAGTVPRYEVRRPEHTDVLPWAVMDTIYGTLSDADGDNKPGPCFATRKEAERVLVGVEREEVTS